MLLNIIAILSAVGIQAASSKPRCGERRADPAARRLIKREFSVAIPAPRNTPRIPAYGLVVSRGLVGLWGVESRLWTLGAITWESLSISRAMRAHACGHGVQSGP